MIGWLKRLIGRGAPWSPAEGTPQPRSAAEVAAVEAALKDLLAAGLRLGPRYETLSLNETAQRIAEHPNFPPNGYGCKPHVLTERSRATLALHILYSYRRPEDGGEEEFANSATFPDDCYDGAEAGDYHDLLRRLIGLADTWTCRAISVTQIPWPEPHDHGFHITFETDPPIPPLTFPEDKMLDGILFEQLNANRPSGEMRRFQGTGDGGTILVLFVTDTEARQIERCIGFSAGHLG